MDDGAACRQRQRSVEIDICKPAGKTLAGDTKYGIGNRGAGYGDEGGASDGRQQDLIRRSMTHHVEYRGAQRVAHRPADEGAQPEVQETLAHSKGVFNTEGTGD